MMPSFGSPKGEGRHDSSEAKRRRRSVVRLIHPKAEPVPLSIDIGAVGVVRRSDFRGCMDGLAPLAFVPPPTPPPEVRLNGFSGALAEVPPHRSDGCGRKVPDAAPTGVSGAAKVGEPAYPRYNRGAGEGRCPFDPRQTRAPLDCAGGGVAPLPPVAARPDG